jgi:hypothetical protein
MSAMNGQMQNENIQPLIDAITAFSNLKTKYEKAMQRYLPRIISCVNGLNRIKERLLEMNRDQQANKAAQLKNALDMLLPTLESELNAVENILNKSTEIMAQDIYTASASNNKVTVSLNIRSNFDSVIKKINEVGDELSLELSNIIKSTCNSDEQQNLLHLFGDLPTCNKDDTFFVLTNTDHKKHVDGNMFAVFVRKNGDWQLLNIPSMTEVRVTCTPASTSAELQWRVPSEAFTQFVVQHREKTSMRNGTYTLSSNLQATKNNYTVSNLQSDTDYEIILLCRVGCGLFVPSFHKDVHTLPPGLLVKYWPSQKVAGTVATIAVCTCLGYKFNVFRHIGTYLNYLYGNKVQVYMKT